MKRQRETRGKGGARSSSTETSDGGGLHRVLVTAAAALIALGLCVHFLTVGGEPEAGDGETPSGPRFRVASDPSARLDELFELSGLDRFVDDFDGLHGPFFEQKFAKQAKSRGADDSDIAFVRSVAPNAFNEEALRGTLRNWLAMRFRDDTLAQLIERIDMPSIQRSLRAEEKLEGADAEARLQAYAAGLQSEPMGERRRRALENIVKAQGSAEHMIAIRTMLERSVIEAAGIVARDRDSMTAQKETHSRVADVRDMLEWAEPAVREQAVVQTAWLLDDFTVVELENLRRALDDPLLERLGRETVRGLENFYLEAGSWLSSRARNAGH